MHFTQLIYSYKKLLIIYNESLTYTIKLSSNVYVTTINLYHYKLMTQYYNFDLLKRFL